MLEKGVFPLDNVRRSIMNSETRFIENETYRNLRDWYIFRDYMTSLDHVVNMLKNSAKRRRHKTSLSHIDIDL
jgi:hypothetical protein